MDSEELKLEKLRLRIETRLRRSELKLEEERLRVEQHSNKGWKTILTPTGAAVAAGLIGLCATAASKYADLQIERKKAETTVILKASEIPENASTDSREVQRARNLLWFAQAGYVTLPSKFVEQLTKDAQLPNGQVPSAPIVQSFSANVQRKPIEFSGQNFTASEFKKYVNTLHFDEWKPQFIVLHSTGEPTLAGWHTMPARQRLANLADYYGELQGWSAGPHLLVADDFIWLFTPLTKPGVHCPSWNTVSWGVMLVGSYDVEPLNEKVRDNAVAAIAALDEAIGASPESLRFHSEDPKTTHSNCPGRYVIKTDIIERVRQLMLKK